MREKRISGGRGLHVNSSLGESTVTPASSVTLEANRRINKRFANNAQERAKEAQIEAAKVKAENARLFVSIIVAKLSPEQRAALQALHSLQDEVIRDDTGRHGQTRGISGPENYLKLAQKVFVLMGDTPFSDQKMKFNFETRFAVNGKADNSNPAVRGMRDLFDQIKPALTLAFGEREQGLKGGAKNPKLYRQWLDGQVSALREEQGDDFQEVDLDAAKQWGEAIKLFRGVKRYPR